MSACVEMVSLPNNASLLLVIRSYRGLKYLQISFEHRDNDLELTSVQNALQGAAEYIMRG